MTTTEQEQTAARKWFDEVVAEARPIYELFVRESTRGAIVVAAGALHDALGELLDAAMVAEDDARELIEGRGPLASFGARIMAAYCFGLISEDARTTLDRVRKIRNIFAHKVADLSFDSPQIYDNVKLLAPVPTEFGPPEGLTITREVEARARFIWACGTAFLHLRALRSVLRMFGRRPVKGESAIALSDRMRAEHERELKRERDELDRRREQLEADWAATEKAFDAVRDRILRGEVNEDQVEAELEKTKQELLSKADSGRAP